MGGMAAKKDINPQNLIPWMLFCNQRAGIPCSANCPLQWPLASGSAADSGDLLRLS